MILARLLAVVLATSPDAASTIAWEVPLACPDADWLATRVEAYLGRPLHDDELKHATERGFAGRVRAIEGGFELELVAGDSSTQRHHVADHDCQQLADVAASLLAIAIDPLALGPVVPLEHSEPPILVPPLPANSVGRREAALALSLEPVRVEDPAPNWELIPISEPSPRDRIKPSAKAGLRGLAVAEAGLALNLFPNPAPQVHAGLGLELHEPNARVAARIELLGGAALAGRFRANDGRELGGELLAWDLALRPCVIPRWGRFDVRACADVGAGQLRARGIGVQNPRWLAQGWLWAGGDLGLAMALQRRDAEPRVGAALILDIGAGANVIRPNFVVLDAGGGTSVSYVMRVRSLRERAEQPPAHALARSRALLVVGLGESTMIASGSAGLGFAGLAKLAAAIAAVAVAGAGVLAAERAPDEQAPIEIAAEHEPAKSRPTTATVGLLSVAPAGEDAIDELAPIPVTAPAIRRREPRPDPYELLRQARKALVDDEPAQALVLLASIPKKSATLRSERVATEVAALCRLDRSSDARAAVERFAAAEPDSPLLARLESACW